MSADTGGSGSAKESVDQRVNRELIELLNELRVALPGVQVLFAFLLAVPFATGFERTTTFERDLYFVTLVLTAIATVLFIAPSAYHRINFRGGDKEQMLLTSNALMLAGLAVLAMSIISAVVLVADFLFGPAVTIAVAVLGIGLFAGAWLVLPLMRRNPKLTPDRRR